MRCGDGVGLPVQTVAKVSQGMPDVVSLIRAGQVQLIINAPRGRCSHFDGMQICQVALAMDVPLLMTLSAAAPAVAGIRVMRAKELRYRSLQAHTARQVRKQNGREF